MKRILSVFISFLLIAVIGLSQAVSAASIIASVDMQTEKAKRTILLYICGADLEEDCAMATYNLKQVMNARFSADEDVRCVVMTGGSFEWHMESEYLRDPDDLGLAVSEESGEYIISYENNQLWEAKGADDPEHPSTLTLLDADGITGAPGTAVPSEDELMTDPETLKAFINYGDEYVLHLNNVNERVVQGAERNIYAELPALEDYIDKHQEKNRLYLEYAGMLSVGTVYGMIDDSMYDNSDADSGENGVVSSWRLSTFEQKWYAVSDADGNNHVAAIHKMDENAVQIPAFYRSYEDPHAVYLEFRYGNDEEEPVLDTIWFISANGSVRGTKAKELTDELIVYPMIYASTYFRSFACRSARRRLPSQKITTALSD
ncbi:MAG: hypothetical protein IJG87_01325 [Ruminococcus sp.]|nr:hypothetical protein [Ruminococcus sp.]